MSDAPLTAQQALALAHAAFQRGERNQARRWAVRAAQLNPHWEDPWLLLAAIASPQASVRYLERALAINPHSTRARKGLGWAAARDMSNKAIPILRPAKRTRPAATQPVMTVIGGLVGILLAAIVLVGLAISYNLASPYLAQSLQFSPGKNTAQAGIRPGALATPSALAAQPVQPGPTLLPQNTPFQPAPTALPTSLPVVDLALTPPALEQPQTTQSVVAVEPPLPTKTKKPVFLPPGVGQEERWIDVDLSKQKTYAYQGNELVQIFRVSTGTWQTPTVTGVYRIYVKYRTQTMSGDDYYLPNVPYVMYFYEGYGLHGTYWHNNFGTPMSHGCVNMKTGEAGWLYDWASVGTVVNVHP